MKTDCHKTKHPTPYTLHPTLHNTTLHSLHPTPSITDHKQAMIHQGERLTLTPTPFTLEDDHALVAMQDVHAAGQGARLSHLGGVQHEVQQRLAAHGSEGDAARVTLVQRFATAILAGTIVCNVSTVVW